MKKIIRLMVFILVFQIQVLGSLKYSQDKDINVLDQRKRLGLDMGVRKSYQMEYQNSPLIFIQSSGCMAARRPSGREVSRLLLELLRDMEGEHGGLITDFIQTLNEGELIIKGYGATDTDSLLRSLVLDMKEPVATLPRVMAVAWLMLTDMNIVAQWGWCPIEYVNKYVLGVKKSQLYKDMKRLEQILDRARFLVEEFIHSCTQGTMFDDSLKLTSTPTAHHKRSRIKEELKRYFNVNGRRTALTTETDDPKDWYTERSGEGADSADGEKQLGPEDTEEEDQGVPETTQKEVATTTTTTTTRRTTRRTTTSWPIPIKATKATTTEIYNLTDDDECTEKSCSSSSLGFAKLSLVSKLCGDLQWKMLLLTICLNYS